jgi:hypothetical protein
MNLTLADMGVIEFHEAFAGQVRVAVLFWCRCGVVVVWCGVVWFFFLSCFAPLFSFLHFSLLLFRSSTLSLLFSIISP